MVDRQGNIESVLAANGESPANGGDQTKKSFVVVSLFVSTVICVRSFMSEDHTPPRSAGETFALFPTMNC